MLLCFYLEVVVSVTTQTYLGILFSSVDRFS